MTWRERTVAIILLLVARLICADEAIKHEIRNIATRINVDGAKADE